MRRRGLLLKLGFGFACVVATSFAVNAALTIRAGRGPLHRLLEDNLSLHAQTTLREVHRDLLECGQQIRLWSGLSIMDEVLTGDRALVIENLLLELQREDPGRYTKLEVLATDGAVIASTDVSRIGSLREWRTLKPVSSDEADFWLGDFPGQAESETASIAVAHPIRSQFRPEPIGWLVADAAWRRTAEIVSTAGLGGRPQDASGFLALFDGSGRQLGGTFEFVEQVPGLTALAAMEFEGTETREMGTAGTYLVARYAQSIGADPGPELRIVAVWKSDEAGRVVSDFVRAVLGSAALGLALATGASYAISRSLTRRISDLGVGTRRVAEGDLGYRLRESGGDELGDLARSFNRMGERLAEVRIERARLEREILEVSETERQRVGQDLHDGLGQTLTGTALLAKTLETKLRARRDPEADDVHMIGELIDDAIGQTRSVARGLFPVTLDRAGLNVALEDLVMGVRAVTPVECRFSIADDFVEPADRPTALHLYRIAQEAINNALKHGKPSMIEVVLGRDGRVGRLTVKDNGSGPSPQFHHGMGMRLMQYRAALIRGTVEFQGQPGKGTQVSCRFPLAPKNG